MTYSAIIFDAGDTLLAYEPSQAQIYADRMKTLGLSINQTAEKKIALAIEKAAHEQIAKEQNGAPRMADDDFERMLDKIALTCVSKGHGEVMYLEKLRHITLPEQELRIIPGVLETLAALKERKFRLAIVSNHRAWLPDFLEKIGLASFFEAIIVSDIVGFEKPDIRIMQVALEKLSLSASECLYVGDHPFDVFCAKRAGMSCAWLAAPERVLPDSIPYKEDFRINELNDLLSLLPR